MPQATLNRVAAAYEGRVQIQGTAERVFDAVATLDGVRGWWTPLASGSASAGDELRFEFGGREEHIVIRVEESKRPTLVRWACLEHTGAPVWAGTTITSTINRAADETTELTLRHSGIAPALVAPGWERFLASVVALVETGEGAPFRNR